MSADASSPKASIPDALRYASVEDERKNLMRSIISALAEYPERAKACIHMPGRELVDPPEVWIEDIAAWVRLNGEWVSLDLGRGSFQPTANEAFCIRLAAEHWHTAQGDRSPEGGDGEAGSVHESPGPKDAPEPPSPTIQGDSNEE